MLREALFVITGASSNTYVVDGGLLQTAGQGAPDQG
jgi:hypothetical protein